MAALFEVIVFQGMASLARRFETPKSAGHSRDVLNLVTISRLREIAPIHQHNQFSGSERPRRLDMAQFLFAARSAQVAHTAPHAYANTPKDSGGLPSWKVKKVTSYIAQHLSDKISSEILADLCGLSVSHFQRAFLASFGLSPHRYVMQMRLEAARDMLQETNLQIKFVALECGMADQAHLTRVMRSLWATTPAALRRLRPVNASINVVPTFLDSHDTYSMMPV
jgi:AraC-like DNA-binding protein